MTEQAKKYLSDIIQAINLIEHFTADTKSFTEFAEDLKTQSAVERQIGIIGEAVNKLEKLAPEVKIESSYKIISMRNRIIHAYDNIDASIIWAIIRNHLKPLKTDIELLLT
ncbi:MAG TPA: HepT-like ribonuclease domain-containing protein [Lentimicrobium sp.]|nr:HepT-like ribonuclease domain-containing protein [Lentimicrobium sp.]